MLSLLVAAALGATLSSGMKAGPLGVDDSVDQIEACLHAMIVGQNIDLRRAIRLCVCGLVKTNELADLSPEQQLDRAAEFCAEKYREEDDEPTVRAPDTAPDRAAKEELREEVTPGRADGYSAAECAERVGTSMKAEASQAFGGDATQQETFVRSFCECNERIDVDKHPVGSEGMQLEVQRCLLSAAQEAGGDPPSP